MYVQKIYIIVLIYKYHINVCFAFVQDDRAWKGNSGHNPGQDKKVSYDTLFDLLNVWIDSDKLYHDIQNCLT